MSGAASNRKKKRKKKEAGLFIVMIWYGLLLGLVKWLSLLLIHALDANRMHR